MRGLQRNLKEILEIGDAVTDPRIKLEARRIANKCHRYIIDLCTNGIVVNEALKYIQGKMDHLNNQEKKLLQEIKEKGEGEAGAGEAGKAEEDEDIIETDNELESAV